MNVASFSLSHVYYFCVSEELTKVRTKREHFILFTKTDTFCAVIPFLIRTIIVYAVRSEDGYYDLRNNSDLKIPACVQSFSPTIVNYLSVNNTPEESGNNLSIMFNAESTMHLRVFAMTTKIIGYNYVRIKSGFKISAIVTS